METPQATLEAMIHEIENGPELYRPSKFWVEYARINFDQLAQFGFGNFKRSINQTYYNWIPEGFGNNQMRKLIAYWAEKPSLIPYRTKVVGTGGFVHDLFQDKNMMENADSRDLYALFVGLLWHYTLDHDSYGLITNIHEPTVGNPIEVRLGDQLISQDIANSARELLTILECYKFPKNALGEKTSVLEIGAGYGRVGYRTRSAFNCRYVIVDITPALFVSQFYLNEIFGSTMKVFKFRHFDSFAEIEAEFMAADFVFLAPNQLELLPDGIFDVSIAISSLHEMRQDQIDNFLALMQRKTIAAIYIKQWISFHNPIDKIDLPFTAYDLQAPWTRAIMRNDPIQELFFEAVWMR